MGQLSESPDDAPPVTVYPWPGQAQIIGAYIYSPVQLTFLDLICNQINNNLMITTKTLFQLAVSQVATTYHNDISFIRRLSFLLYQTEATFNEITRYLTSNIICEFDLLSNITTNYEHYTNEVNIVWSQIRSSNRTENTITTQAFEIARPDSLTEVGVNQFLGVAAGLTVGLVGGGLIGSLFGSDHTEDINKLNNNLHKVDKKIKFTNNRIDILASNLTTSIEKIRIILEGMNQIQKDKETRALIMWNIQQTKLAATNSLILIKIIENQLALLRKGIISSDVLNIKSFEAVVSEGIRHYSTMMFPIRNIIPENIKEILELIEVQNLGYNKFIIKTPLCRRVPYKIVSLIPHPIKIKSDILMIADMNDLMLYNDGKYIITELDSIKSLYNDTHILTVDSPIYDFNYESCELEALKTNRSNFLKLCNFKKLGSKTGIYLTNTPFKRLLYLTESTKVELDCPGGKIRDTLIGMKLIPVECDIKTDNVVWPAKLHKKIKIEKLIQLTEHNDGFDITNLPIFTVNDTDQVHPSIRVLIDELDSDEPFTIPYNELDLTLEKVQTYNVVASGVLTVLVITNTILIVILYVYKFCKRNLEHDIESGTNTDKFRMSKITRFSPTDSLRLPNRDSFRRVRDRLKYLKEKADTSSLSGFSSVRSSIGSRLKGSKGKVKNLYQSSRKRGRNLVRSAKLDTNTSQNIKLNDLSPVNKTVTNKGTNTLYPYLSSQSELSTPRPERLTKIIPLREYK